MSGRRIWRAWDRFLFEPISPVPLGVYRVIFGLLVFAYALLLGPELDALFGPHGVLPLSAAGRYDPLPRLSVLTWLPSNPVWIYVFYAAFLVAVVFLTLGYHTRAASVAVFVGLVSLHHRNPMILNGGDTLLRLSSFYLMFAPAGAAASLDRLLRARRGIEPPGAPGPVVPWAQRLIQLQMALAYVATVRWKLTGYTWVEGTAVYYATRIREFDRFPVPLLFELRPAMRLMTWGTLVVEFALGTLVWFRPLRYPVLVAGLLLHLGLDYAMNIPLFQWVMVSAYVLFVDPADVRRLTQWWRGRRARPAKDEPTVPSPV